MIGMSGKVRRAGGGMKLEDEEKIGKGGKMGERMEGGLEEDWKR